MPTSVYPQPSRLESIHPFFHHGMLVHDNDRQHTAEPTHPQSSSNEAQDPLPTSKVTAAGSVVKLLPSHPATVVRAPTCIYPVDQLICGLGINSSRHLEASTLTSAHDETSSESNPAHPYVASSARRGVFAQRRSTPTPESDPFLLGFEAGLKPGSCFDAHGEQASKLDAASSGVEHLPSRAPVVPRASEPLIFSSFIPAPSLRPTSYAAARRTRSQYPPPLRDQSTPKPESHAGLIARPGLHFAASGWLGVCKYVRCFDLVA
ncbi:hypothetical protein FB451DRAFT_1554476 [Mycena latifolia]|nr:hypothetical protein FB451DRAFT_1554476 [Mycena latifolia]